MILQRGHPETSDSSEGAEVNGEEEEKRKKKKKKEKKHKKHKSNETGSEVYTLRVVMSQVFAWFYGRWLKLMHHQLSHMTKSCDLADCFCMRPVEIHILIVCGCILNITMSLLFMYAGRGAQEEKEKA